MKAGYGGYVRMEAAKKLKDQTLVQKVFIEIAKSRLLSRMSNSDLTRHEALRIAAIKSITDQSALADIIKSDSIGTVITAAKERLAALR